MLVVRVEGKVILRGIVVNCVFVCVVVWGFGPVVGSGLPVCLSSPIPFIPCLLADCMQPVTSCLLIHKLGYTECF